MADLRVCRDSFVQVTVFRWVSPNPLFRSTSSRLPTHPRKRLFGLTRPLIFLFLNSLQKKAVPPLSRRTSSSLPPQFCALSPVDWCPRSEPHSVVLPSSFPSLSSGRPSDKSLVPRTRSPRALPFRVSSQLFLLLPNFISTSHSTLTPFSTSSLGYSDGPGQESVAKDLRKNLGKRFGTLVLTSNYPVPPGGHSYGTSFPSNLSRPLGSLSLLPSE